MFCVTVDSNLVYANVCKHTDLNKWYCSLEDASRLYSLTMRESTMCAVLFKPFVCGPIAKGDRSKTLNSRGQGHKLFLFEGEREGFTCMRIYPHLKCFEMKIMFGVSIYHMEASTSPVLHGILVG